MNKMSKVILAIASLGPTCTLTALFILGPYLYGLGLERQVVADFVGLARLISVTLIFVMMIYFSRYVRRSTDLALSGKKSLWIAILWLGNVFAVPAFWYFFFVRQSNALGTGRRGPRLRQRGQI